LVAGARVEIPWEGPVEIVGLGDLNRDASDDILLLGLSPGVTMPVVVVSTASGWAAARFSSPDLARQVNLVFNESVYEDCPSIIRGSARFIQAAEGLRLLLRASDGKEATCETILPAWTFVVLETTLALAPDQ
jgi:hypothetical protein